MGVSYSYGRVVLMWACLTLVGMSYSCGRVLPPVGMSYLCGRVLLLWVALSKLVFSVARLGVANLSQILDGIVDIPEPC